LTSVELTDIRQLGIATLGTLKEHPRIFVTTHQPYFVDALASEEVWLLEKGADGYSVIRRVSELQVVKNLVDEGLPLGGFCHLN
jgi:hypothetical protein